VKFFAHKRIFPAYLRVFAAKPAINRVGQKSKPAYFCNNFVYCQAAS